MNDKLYIFILLIGLALMFNESGLYLLNIIGAVIVVGVKLYGWIV